MMRMRNGLLYLLLPLLVGLLAPSVTQGQVLISLLLGDKVTSEKFHLGLDIGLNVSNLSGIDGTKARTGFFLGIFGEWRFARTWYLQPELIPFYFVGANNLPLVDAPPELDDLVTGDEVQRRLKYFAIPILVKYAVANDRLHLGVGPQVGFLTSANDKYTGTSTNGNKVTVEQDISSSTESTDAGILFHLEWKVREGFSPSLNARYYLGLTDTIKDNPGDAVYNRVFSVLLGIPIGGDPAKKGEKSEG